MVEKQKLTCIGCPMGCSLELMIIDGQLQEVNGNNCPRGENYARQEFSDPRRMVSTTVACPSGLWPRLPVKTAEAIPKDRIMEVVRQLHRMEVTAPVEIGQTLVTDVAGTGVAVVASRSLARKSD
ncbi:MAG: DUF1667 domain-containing protein [Desulfuromonadales bacterium]|nr:DUF1667 domain-containing protein [Desulfuromonadales bacterium]MBN2792193.1 DUF1667 domain-containing protein [Desulfuromonadales bacterium]